MAQHVPNVPATRQAVIAEPFAADDIETAVNKLSPRPNQSVERAAVSPMINALTNAAVAAVMASVDKDTEKCQHREEQPGGVNQPEI